MRARAPSVAANTVKTSKPVRIVSLRPETARFRRHLADVDGLKLLRNKMGTLP